MARKVLKLLLSVVITITCLTSVVASTYADKTPVIFVHGLYSWGGYWANTTRMLTSYGYDIDDLYVFLSPRIGTAENGNNDYAVRWITGTFCPSYYSWYPWGNHGNSVYNAPALADLIETVASTSPTGKVDLVAHSNGVHVVREAVDDGDIAALVNNVINIAGWNDAESVENESNCIRYLQEVFPNSSLSSSIHWYALASRSDGALYGQGNYYLNSFTNNVGEAQEYQNFGCFFDAPTFFTATRTGANMHFNARDHDLMTCDPAVIDYIYTVLNNEEPPEPDVQTQVTIRGVLVERPESYSQVPFNTEMPYSSDICTVSLHSFNPTTGIMSSALDTSTVTGGSYSVSAITTGSVRLALRVELHTGTDTYTDVYWFADAILNDMILNLRMPEEITSGLAEGKIRVKLLTAGEYISRGNWYYDPTVSSNDREFGVTKKYLTTMQGEVFLDGVVNETFSNKITAISACRSTNYKNYGSTDLIFSTLYKWDDGSSGYSDYAGKDTRVGLSLNGKDMVYMMVNGNDRSNQINNLFFNIIPAFQPAD